jgi:predicted transcriptional regulator
MAGIADVEAGRVMSSEEFWRRVKEADSEYNKNI